MLKSLSIEYALSSKHCSAVVGGVCCQRCATAVLAKYFENQATFASITNPVLPRPSASTGRHTSTGNEVQPGCAASKSGAVDKNIASSFPSSSLITSLRYTTTSSSTNVVHTNITS